MANVNIWFFFSWKIFPKNLNEKICKLFFHVFKFIKKWHTLRCWYFCFENYEVRCFEIYTGCIIQLGGEAFLLKKFELKNFLSFKLLKNFLWILEIFLSWNFKTWISWILRKISNVEDCWIHWGKNLSSFKFFLL